MNFEILKNLCNIKKRYNYKFWLIQISTDQLYDAISFKTKVDKRKGRAKVGGNFLTNIKILKIFFNTLLIRKNLK